MGQSGRESSLVLRTGLEQGMLHQHSVVKPKEQLQQKRREYASTMKLYRNKTKRERLQEIITIV